MTRSRTPADEPIRVLVVDDDTRVRAAISQTIALEVGLVLLADAAGTAAALTLALALAARTRPPVALVDVLIPDETSGLALIRSLSQYPGWAVVAISVRDDLGSAALAAGAAAFVGKGAGIDAILDAVRATAATAATAAAPPTS
ncbi:MAG TPA: response regulator [Streptosporangiaceae bacterium]|jgi:DNA-binding NarL/FixJ family response regulator